MVSDWLQRELEIIAPHVEDNLRMKEFLIMVRTHEVLRAWADALNAVADLQEAIIEAAENEEMTEDQLKPLRATVFGTVKSLFPNGANTEENLQAARATKKLATEQRAWLTEF
jgi:hypothetical protein